MMLGNRIQFFRNLRGLTQKALGKLVGFPEESADVRMAQYESYKHEPKQEVISSLAKILDVSEYALSVPDMDDCEIMHFLFALEDTHALMIDKIDGYICIRLNTEKDGFTETLQLFSQWYEAAKKFRCGEISREDYNQWRYNFPDWFLDDKYGIEELTEITRKFSNNNAARRMALKKYCNLVNLAKANAEYNEVAKPKQQYVVTKARALRKQKSSPREIRDFKAETKALNAELNQLKVDIIGRYS